MKVDKRDLPSSWRVPQDRKYLANYDEYTHLKRIKAIDPADLRLIERLQAGQSILTDEQVERMQHLRYHHRPQGRITALPTMIYVNGVIGRMSAA